MKRMILAASLLTALSSSAFAAEPTQGFFEPSRVDVAAGLSAQEGEAGYFVNAQWNVSRYAAIGIGADSFVRKASYPVGAFVDTVEFADDTFRPRHSTYSLFGTLRYPIALNDASELAPFITVGYNRLSTEDVEFGGSDSANSGDDVSGGTSDEPDLVLSFEDFSAFSVRAGAQWQINKNHMLSAGAIAYSLEEDWSEISLEDQYEGGFVHYQYQHNSLLGMHLGVDSVNMFGDVNARLGLTLSF